MNGRFGKVDLGTDRAMARIMAAEKAKRLSVIDECIMVAMGVDPHGQAWVALEAFKKEVELES